MQTFSLEEGQHADVAMMADGFENWLQFPFEPRLQGVHG